MNVPTTSHVACLTRCETICQGELIADYSGIVAATGQYRADWFLRFLGLESFPHYQQGGRLQNYRGQPPLSDGAFKILQALVSAAAENLELFDTEHTDKLRDSNIQPLMLTSLTYLTLEELASQEAKFRIQQTLDQFSFESLHLAPFSTRGGASLLSFPG